MKRFLLILSSLTISCIILAKPFDSGNWFSPLKNWFKTNKKTWIALNAYSAAFTPDGKQIALSMNNRTVEIRDISSGATNNIIDFSMLDGGILTKAGSITFSPNNQMMAVAFPENKKVYIIDKNKMKILHRLKVNFSPQKIRFSPRSRFLLIGEKPFLDQHRAIYAIYHRYFFYQSKKAIIGDFSRTDRYFFYCRAQKELVWIDAVTKRRLRSVRLAKLNGGSRVLSLRVLRDHRIALGGTQTVHIISRHLRKKEMVHYQPFLNATIIIPDAGNRFLIIGSKQRYFLLRLHENKSKQLMLPLPISHLEIYPSEPAILFANLQSSSVQVARINIKRAEWR